MAARTSRTAWPPQCCVPAFLGTAAAALAGSLDALAGEETRRDLAVALGVAVSPADANPWGLRVSARENEWGVKVRDIEGRLESVEKALGCSFELHLEVTGFDTVAFRMYEDAIADLVDRGAVVGVSFDYEELVGRRTVQDGETQPGRHLARVTPFGEERDHEPNVLSRDFGFDYSGDLWLFDDSGEMGESDCFVSWPRLIRACWAVDGGLWAVHRVEVER